MNWTVGWVPSAEQDLAELWNNAPDRAAVTVAANAIDALLAHDPTSAGEGPEGGRRMLFVEPLAVGFRVDEANHTVTVYAVWRWPE
jgi:hypothetical protein